MFIGIVADDLTGATDSVAPFAQQGYTAGVCLSANTGTSAPDCAWDAVAVNTGIRDRRRINTTLITSIVRRATRRLVACEPHLYFKKIDSTLRGHLRAELDGMLGELPGRMALICPASPANGRTVENGILYVHGVPLSETGFIAGAAEPERFATVRAAFGMSNDLTAGEIYLSVLRAGHASVDAELERRFDAGVRTLFCDAAAPNDLRILAQALLRRPERYLPVGSAGFTRALSESLPVNAEAESPSWNESIFTRGRVLIAIGSLHPISRRQARRVLEESGIRPLILHLGGEVEELLNEEIFRERLRAGENLFVMITPEAVNTPGSHYPIERLLWDMALWADLPVTESPFDGYVVSGGDTAQKICNAWHGKYLRISGENEPGVVCATMARYGDQPDIPMILKAGGFGDEGTLARCVGLE